MKASPAQIEIMHSLEKLTEEAISKARFTPQGTFEMEAINWGDLHCHCVELVFPSTNPNKPFYRVVIEEASPDAKEFQQYIFNDIAMKFEDDFDVVTEW